MSVTVTPHEEIVITENTTNNNFDWIVRCYNSNLNEENPGYQCTERAGSSPSYKSAYNEAIESVNKVKGEL